MVAGFILRGAIFFVQHMPRKGLCTALYYSMTILFAVELAILKNRPQAGINLYGDFNCPQLKLIH